MTRLKQRHEVEKKMARFKKRDALILPFKISILPNIGISNIFIQEKIQLGDIQMIKSSICQISIQTISISKSINPKICR